MNQLIKWNMISIENTADIEPHTTHIDIVPHKDAPEYQKIKKFNINNLSD